MEPQGRKKDLTVSCDETKHETTSPEQDHSITSARSNSWAECRDKNVSAPSRRRRMSLDIPFYRTSPVTAFTRHYEQLASLRRGFCCKFGARLPGRGYGETLDSEVKWSTNSMLSSAESAQSGLPPRLFIAESCRMTPSVPFSRRRIWRNCAPGKACLFRCFLGDKSSIQARTLPLRTGMLAHEG